MKNLLLLYCSFSLILFVKAQPNNNIQPNGNGQITPIGLLNNANMFTVEFWVKTTENGSNNTYWQRPCLFGNATDGNNSGDFGINMNNGYVGMWEGLSNTNTDQFFLSNNVRINDDQWHHIAAVNDGRNITLFVDGSRIASLISGRQLNTSRAPLTFGASSLDFSWNGNSRYNTNFASRSIFGETMLSNTVRYRGNFTPQQTFYADANTVQMYHFGVQGNGNYNQQGQGYNQQNQGQNNQQSQPQYNNQYSNQQYNQPPQYPQGNDEKYAQMGKVYFNDNTLHEGRITIDKQQYNPNNDIIIRFAEGNSSQFNYYRPEEIKGFQIGNDYYETKFISAPEVTFNNKKTIVKLITSVDSRIPMYVFENRTKTVDATTKREQFNTALVYLIGLPGSKDDKVYGFQSNLFSPKFDEKVSVIVQDAPALAAKVKSRDKDFFYAAFTGDDHRLKVWWNIINEYNSTKQ